MRIPRFYQAPPLTEGSLQTLSEAAAHHAVQVLRLSPGDPLILFDGQGREFRCELTSIGKRSAQVKIGAPHINQVESPLAIHLMQGIPRGERMDFLLQKAVELGVSVITPVFTERCEVKLAGERLEKRLHHWQGVITHACEQSGRAVLPQLHLPTPLEDGLETAPNGLKLVLHHRTTHRLTTLSPPASGVTLLIGPEGGLSEKEISLAMSRGFIGIALGPRIMRTETAPLAAITALQCLWGDMG